MSFSDNWALSYTQTPGAQVVSTSITLVGNTQENVDLLVNANSQTECDVQLFKANLQALLIFCDQSITLKTNSSGAPQDTLNVQANVPYVWTVNLNSIFACPFSNNVSKLFVNTVAVVNVQSNFKLRSIANN
jgi:hypothetical protein